jgi:hypothetical protein
MIIQDHRANKWQKYDSQSDFLTPKILVIPTYLKNIWLFKITYVIEDNFVTHLGLIMVVLHHFLLLAILFL